jgi:tetratricopeptide (TPR) repeat protein
MLNRELNQSKKIILIFCFFLLIFLGYQAIKMLSANLSFYQAFQLENNWQKNKSLSSATQFEQALKEIEQSNLSHPNNPHYLVTQGEIYEWGGISDEFDENKQRELLLQAKRYYLNAVELRPTWPFTWATLAVLKWRLEEIDQEMINFLKQADKYGQHTAGVSRAWLDVGFYIYKNKSVFTPQIIAGLRKHLKISMADIRPEIRRSTLSIVKRHNASLLLCSWSINYSFDTSWYDKALCQDKKN